MQDREARRKMLQQEAMIERTSRVYLWKAASLKVSSAGTEGV